MTHDSFTDSVIVIKTTLTKQFNRICRHRQINSMFKKQTAAKTTNIIQLATKQPIHPSVL